MMTLPAFSYHAPRTLEEAVALLADLGPQAVVVAGGTGLYPNMKRRQLDVEAVVSLEAIEDLRRIRVGESGELVIGALTVLSDLAVSADVPTALASAAGQVASPQIRNMATVGGNLCLDTRCNYFDMSEDWRRGVDFCMKLGGEVCWLAPQSSKCWAVSSSDLAPVVMALEAQVRLASARGERLVPASDLFRNDGIDHLAKAPDEILVEVVFPPADGTRATYLKLRRRGTIDFPILSVAAAVDLGPDGRCRGAHIVLGAIASAPLQAAAAEQLLAGNRLTPELIEEAARIASGPARPLDNTDLNSRYRKWMVSVYVARALRELL